MTPVDISELSDIAAQDHSRMVGRISGLLARHAGYAPEEAALIEQAARLHDVGKAGIAPEIWSKPGPLTEQEYAIVKTHAKLGADKIMSALRTLSAAIVIAAQHHEHIDGAGYIGLTGQVIHPYAKLVAVADTYDALVSTREYKARWSASDACGWIKQQAEKLSTLRLYMKKTQADLDGELEKCIDRLCEKHIPKDVRELFEMRRKEMPERPPRPPRARPSARRESAGDDGQGV